MKQFNTPSGTVEEQGLAERVKRKENEKEKEIFNDNWLMTKSSLDYEDINPTSSTLKEKEEKGESKEEILYCKECKYKCKKESPLKKHVITKHDVHQCKQCHEQLPTHMSFLKNMLQNITLRIQARARKTYLKMKLFSIVRLL